MRPAAASLRGMELDDFIRAYEVAWGSGEGAELNAFLPDPEDPLYGSVLREIVRVDLELRWVHGEPKPLEDYRRSFPELFIDRESLHAITFEEYRVRRGLGEAATPEEYEQRFGVDATTWPSLEPASAFGDSSGTARSAAWSVEAVARSGPARSEKGAPAYQARGRAGPERASDGARWEHRAGSSEGVLGSEELRRSKPGGANPPSRAVPVVPAIGSELLGFRVLAELGAGTFGHVYLARQEELAARLVVLKVAPHLFDESRTLAQLQHANIVPIYSVHQAESFQAVCMPFAGTTTVADILTDLRKRAVLPDSGKYLQDRIEAEVVSRPRMWGNEQSELCGERSCDLRPPLASLSYVDVILWMATKLADGLAHAHARGIVHRDLKPANILLTDDGQPMLLDFNLSADSKLDANTAAARVGGTLLYMAPEQLAAMQMGTRPGDERSDLYSFGIILHEMLTGRHPFAPLYGPCSDVRYALGKERRGPPDVRRWNQAVSPGTESIVRHCLEPDPSLRYRTARELHEDLRRQSEHRPLKYAPESSLAERARKWIRRHPRLSFSTGVVAAGTLLFLVLAGAFLLRESRLARRGVEQEAERTGALAVTARYRLHDDLKTIEFLLGSEIPDAEHEQREEGMALARAALDRYRVLELPRWQDAPLVSALAREQREQVRDDMGEILLLLAGAVADRTQLDFALRLNDLAAGCYVSDAIPRAISRQRALLVRSAGHSEEGERLLKEAEAAPVQSARDRYLLLLTQFRQRGRFPEAISWLKEASRHQNDNFSVWLTVGNYYAALGKLDDAVACFDMAGALWPKAHWPYMCRGMAYLEQGNDRQAVAAFDEVIRLRPETLHVYYNRALAKYHLGDLAGARADLTHLLSEPRPPVRGYFLRAKVRAKEGDREGARRDQEEGLRGEARDERDLTARGLVRQPRDPAGALADYERALELNPRYRTALQNKANVLAEDLGRTEEAIAALDALLALYPKHAPAVAGRGVLYARIGRRAAAHADARVALTLDTKPFNVYQVAGIYALTSRQNPGDRLEALRLLEIALSQGFGLDLVEKDRDLDAIRDGLEFRQLVESARARRAAPRAAGEQRGRALPRGGANAPSG